CRDLVGESPANGRGQADTDPPPTGGSHAAVLDGWRAPSRHQIEVLALPARHWKWRMRHAAWTLSQQAAALEHTDFDLVWATDMLELAAWRGLAPAALAALPHVLYQHETQLLYPDPTGTERDAHFAFSNVLSAAAADAVWWNSAWHRDTALAAWHTWLSRFPDHQPTDTLNQIAARSQVLYPGIEPPVPGQRPSDQAPHLLWCARWEADKDPEAFATAVHQLADQGHRFRFSMIGGHDTGRFPALAALRAAHGDRIVHWGWLESRAAYHAALAEADIVVSTAQHEFFGLAVLEAVAAGARPLLPRRLAYPEIYAALGEEVFYRDGTLAAALAARLADPQAIDAAAVSAPYLWPKQASRWDDAAQAMRL
nr:DUF3524 domain-containing protein [Planctomycetota bacterium]